MNTKLGDLFLESVGNSIPWKGGTILCNKMDNGYRADVDVWLSPDRKVIVILDQCLEYWYLTCFFATRRSVDFVIKCNDSFQELNDWEIGNHNTVT